MPPTLVEITTTIYLHSFEKNNPMKMKRLVLNSVECRYVVVCVHCHATHTINGIAALILNTGNLHTSIILYANGSVFFLCILCT